MGGTEAVVGQVAGIDVKRVLHVVGPRDLVVEFSNEPGVAWRAQGHRLRNGETVVLLARLGDVGEWE